eukprot:1161352-Pelagomonas_calceolata.AAC.8
MRQGTSIAASHAPVEHSGQSCSKTLRSIQSNRQTSNRPAAQTGGKQHAPPTCRPAPLTSKNLLLAEDKAP